MPKLRMMSALPTCLLALLVFFGWKPIHAQEAAVTAEPEKIQEPVALQTYLTNHLFWSQEKGHISETSLMIPGHQLTYAQQENGKYQASVEVVVLFKEAEAVRFVEKYNLLSLEFDDSNDYQIGLMDMKRLSFEPGNYSAKISLSDLNNLNASGEHEIAFIVPEAHSTPDFSSIQLLREANKAKAGTAFTKNGYNLVPLMHDYYPPALKKLSFYTEFYSKSVIPEGTDLLVRYAIVEHPDEGVTAFSGFKKISAKAANPVLGSFNIDKLPSGNYDLLLEVRDKENNLVAKKKHFFQRRNEDFAAITQVDAHYIDNYAPEFDLQELKFRLRALYPIASINENNMLTALDRSEDFDKLMQYYISFWLRRDEHDPRRQWEAYNTYVDQVQFKFKTSIEDGFETDRGRVELQYGPPDQISRQKDPGGSDYRVWHYYALPDKQTDIKFVFYNPTQIPEHFELIHSNARGEISDPQWRLKIYDAIKGPSGAHGFDDTRLNQGHFGSSIDNFEGF